jgi:type I restriction enzyme, S subunit
MSNSDWIELELGELIDVKHGFAFRGEYFHDAPPGDILLTPGNFAIGGGFKYDKLKYYRGPVPDEYVLEPGTLLVTMTDLSKEADTLGYPALVPQTETEGRFLHNQRLGLVTIKDPKRLSRRFLYYLMCTRSYRNEIIAGATGTTVKHTSPKRILRCKVSLPSLPVQEAIAEILSSFDDKLSSNRKMNRTLEDLARAVFRAWFVDLDPIKTKMQGGTSFPGLPGHVFDQLPAELLESEVGPIPANWRAVPLSSIASLLSGGTPKRKVADYWGGTIPWFSVRDAPEEGDVWVIETQENITETGVENSAAQVLRSGTTIITARGTVGRLALAGVPMAINQSCYGLQGMGGAGDYFVYFAIRQAVGELRQRTHGSVFDTITRQTFQTIWHALPPPAVLEAFEEAVAPYVERIRSNRFESRTLALIRDALLHRLLHGDLRIGVDHGAGS